MKSTGNGRIAGNVVFKEFGYSINKETKESSGVHLLSVSDIALMWLASGKCESCSFGFSPEELEKAL